MLEKEAFRMATGGEEGCALVKAGELQKAVLKIWSDWIEAQDLGVEGLLEKGPGQPLRLRLIRALLQAADDPDRDFLLRAEEGLFVGILEPLPRTPHVFEEQEKWPLDSDPWEPSLAWVPNYSSKGLMEKMSMESFRQLSMVKTRL